MSGIIAIDDGGFSSVVVTRNQEEMFPSIKGLAGRRNLSTPKGKHDFVVEWKGKTFVAGDLGFDCSLPLRMNTQSKANDFFDLSVLIGIHKYGYLSNYLLVSVPLEKYTDEELKARTERLKTSHTLIVNDVRKTFVINELKLAPETASAFWIEKPTGLVNWLDLGSRTIGYTSTINNNGECRFIDSRSGTIFGKGLEALQENYNPEELADFICGGYLTSIWKSNEVLYVLGGGALDSTLIQHIRRYFPKLTVVPNPQTATARGMYLLGRMAFQMT